VIGLHALGRQTNRDAARLGGQRRRRATVHSRERAFGFFTASPSSASSSAPIGNETLASTRTGSEPPRKGAEASIFFSDTLTSTRPTSSSSSKKHHPASAVLEDAVAVVLDDPCDAHLGPLGESSELGGRGDVEATKLFTVAIERVPRHVEAERCFSRFSISREVPRIAHRVIAELLKTVVGAFSILEEREKRGLSGFPILARAPRTLEREVDGCLRAGSGDPSRCQRGIEGPHSMSDSSVALFTRRASMRLAKSKRS